MNTKQTEIYEGLKSIGEEIASFYADGVDMINSDYKTKSYLIAHISREIDGGLRDIFAKDEDKKRVQKSLSSEELNELKDKKGHIASILTALNVDFNSEFARKWIVVATEFVNFAHRHGAYRNAREPEKIIEIWNKYEDILIFLVGNYLNLLDRIDRLLEYDVPTSEIIETLPNLLKHQARYVYFFNNLKSLNWLKPLFEKGYFSGKNNLEPIEVENKQGYYSVPFWSVLEYLKKVSKQNFENPNEQTTKILVKVIFDIINFKKDDGKRIENYHTDYSVLQLIGLLPTDEIKDEHFDFIQSALIGQFNSSVVASEIGKVLLKRFIEEKNERLVLKTLKIVLSYIKIENKLDLHPLMTEHWLKETLRIFKNDILEQFPLQVYTLAINYINEISEKHKTSFNSISLPAIEDHPQTMFPEKYECQIIYLVRDALLKIKPQELSKIVSDLFKGDRICVRLAIYTINQRYDILSELFWKWKENPLVDDISYKHELYELFRNHAKDFTEEELMIITKWIEEKEYWVSDEKKEDEELVNKIIAYKKREWLFSLLASGNKAIQEKYDKYYEINPIENKHPGLDSWHSGLVGSTSPLSKDDVLSKSLSENIDYFIDFSKEKKDFMGPSIDGLSGILVEAIKEHPENFIKNCETVISAPSYFQYTWIRGLNESWRHDKTFNVEEVFKATLAVIRKPEFWVNNNTKQRADENSFISELTRFIEAGVQNDSHVFDVGNLKIIKNILLLVLRNDKKAIFDYSELSMTALNTSKGKTYSAIIQYSLKLARENKEKEDKWDKDIIKEIENILKADETDELLFFTLGQYFRNLLFISNKWTIDNFNVIFSLKNTDNFVAAISGYFFYNPDVYKDIFQKFYENGIFKKALTYDLDKERSDIKRNIVNQICIALSYGFIGSDDILMDIILSKERISLFTHLHHFFWDAKRHTTEIKAQIQPLWKKIFEKYKTDDNEEIKSEFLGKISLWLENIEEFDNETYERIKFSIKYIDDRYYFIKSLNKHIKNTTEKVANILILLFEIKVEYDISRGIIQNMVKTIYEKGLKEQADKICILHADKGNYILRDIYKQNN